MGHKSGGKGTPAHLVCQGCGERRTASLREDGKRRVFTHYVNGERCEGSGEVPIDIDAFTLRPATSGPDEAVPAMRREGVHGAARLEAAPDA